MLPSGHSAWLRITPPDASHPFDLVIVRELTEGFYADRNMADGNADLEIKLGETGSSQRYADNFNTRYERIEKLCRDYRILLTKLATTEEPLVILQRVLGL